MTSTITQHPFDTAVALTRQADGIWAGATSADYANMVGPFGGITAATMLRAALEHPERLGDPLAFTVNFAGPIADGPFTVTADAARTNRSTQHWTIRLEQDGVVTTTATAVFGVRRETWGDTEVAPPPVPDAEAVAIAPPSELVTWVKNYEMRFVTGDLTLDRPAPEDDSTTTLWVRDHPARPLDFTALTAICDVFFPRVMVRLGQPVPAGTVSLTVYFHADQDQLTAQADAPVLATAHAQHFGNGYFDQSAHVWTPGGALLATSHQLVYYKA